MTDDMPKTIWLEHPSACDPQAGQMWCVDKDALCEEADYPPVKYLRAEALAEVREALKVSDRWLQSYWSRPRLSNYDREKLGSLVRSNREALKILDGLMGREG